MNFSVALVGDTALVGAVPSLANDLRYGDGNFGEGCCGAHQLIIAYRVGLRLVARHLMRLLGWWLGRLLSGGMGCISYFGGGVFNGIKHRYS